MPKFEFVKLIFLWMGIVTVWLHLWFSNIKTSNYKMNLQPFIERIQLSKPFEQTLSFNPEHWENFKFNFTDINDDVNEIIGEYKNKISRQDIINFFSNSNSSLRKGFIMTMIWGHGSSEHGKADNRGPWKVNQMFNNLKNSEQMLNIAIENILKENIIEAHDAFKNMERCRVNFFSKFLYFYGKGKQLQNYPLIFDARVAMTIGSILSYNSELVSTLNIQPKQDSNSYKTYVTQIHNSAKEYNVEADKIEFFLFQGL